MRTTLLFLVWTSFFGIVVSDLVAQENTRTVIATGQQYIVGMSPEAAHDLALANALSNAKDSVGLTVQQLKVWGLTSYNSEIDEAYIRYTKTQSHGKVLNYKILERQIESSKEGILIAQVKVNAEIATDTRNPDFDLVAGFTGNKIHYNDGDLLSLEITSSKDCYLYIFHIYGTHKAAVWLPDDKWFQSNFLKAHTTRTIPSPVNETPISLSLTKGRDLEIDHVLIVASTKQIGFADAKLIQDKGLAYKATTLFKINKWLLQEFQNNERTELYLPFFIHSGSIASDFLFEEATDEE